MIPYNWLQERLTDDTIRTLATGGRDAYDSAASDDRLAWPEIALAILQGDEVWRYCSPLSTWQGGHGQRGLAVVRGGVIVAAAASYVSQASRNHSPPPAETSLPQQSVLPLLERLCVVLTTVPGCVGAGITAGLIAFATEFSWPLSDGYFEYAVRLGACWGAIAALNTAAMLLLIDRKHLWLTALLAIGITGLVTCAGVWWHVVNGLG